VPALCGKCHSNIDYMKRFQASPRTDQLAEYWTSGHGKALKAKEDKEVATCTSCHNKPHGSAASPDGHGIRPVSDLESPVYRTHVAETCSKCHSDAKLMAGRQYHGKPLRTDQYEQWRESVHAQALLKKGDLSAPTCNNCHGNHGAVPPQVDSVANVCGTCHGRVVKFFADTKMKHSFEKAGLPGCVTCHGNHRIDRPSDEMLGMEGGAVCLKCHADGKYGATLAGAETAKTLRSGLDNLRAMIQEADETLTKAGRLGMEVSKPRFELRKATDALTNARVQIHSFALEPSQKLIADGQAVATAVHDRGEALLAEHDARRVWLAASLVPIVVVVVLLLLYIRRLPIPQPPPS
jgi:predicted CXXCH cytochrome family protein